ncbi:MAG: hypothetical protein IKF79_07450 [Methanosphaera sp.]|nr:hypothetical protein [Methanosphaera sp.]
MSNYIIVINQKNLKSKNSLYDNTFLNKLTDIVISNKNFVGINKFIRDMFYLKCIDEYDIALNKNIVGYENDYQLFIDVYNLFKEYKPYEIYDLGFFRGFFLELLSYKYLKNLYEEESIYRESKIKIGEYESHYWDIIINKEEVLKLYECKFSSKSIKRSHLDKMFGLQNKLIQSKVYLVTFELKDLVWDDLKGLINNTNQEKFESILNSFNYMFLEDYVIKNPFDN